ncbi:hypothetical protein [Geodermatophilus sp. SYSU D01119]
MCEDLSEDAVLDVVDRALGGLPQGAVTIRRRGLGEHEVLELSPCRPGAVSVVVDWRLDGVHVFVGEVGPPIEIAAPLNTDHGPPDRPWDEDLLEVLTAVGAGRVSIGMRDGVPSDLVLESSRLGVRSRPGRALAWERPAPWS